MANEDCITELKQQLKEAKAAYHQLMMGGSVRVVVDQNGERVEYTAANKQSLFNYIKILEAQICSPNPCSGGATRNGPAGFLFP